MKPCVWQSTFATHFFCILSKIQKGKNEWLNSTFFLFASKKGGEKWERKKKYVIL